MVDAVVIALREPRVWVLGRLFGVGRSALHRDLGRVSTKTPLVALVID